MSTSNLDRTLNSVLDEIRDGLADRVKQAFKNIVNEVRKADGLQALTKKKEELEEKKMKIAKEYDDKLRRVGNEIDLIRTEIDQKDGFNAEEMTTYETDLFRTATTKYCNPTKSEAKSAKRLIKQTEGQNYLNFLKIEKNTRMMYNLAVTAKEKRNIIFNLQARDWRSLGVEIPQLPHFEKFEIEDGIIKVPDKPLLQAKN